MASTVRNTRGNASGGDEVVVVVVVVVVVPESGLLVGRHGSDLLKYQYYHCHFRLHLRRSSSSAAGLIRSEKTHVLSGRPLNPVAFLQ
jgi:hypothetical protein